MTKSNITNGSLFLAFMFAMLFAWYMAYGLPTANASVKPQFNPFCDDQECPYNENGYTQCLGLYECFQINNYYAECEPDVYEGQAALVVVDSCD